MLSMDYSSLKKSERAGVEFLARCAAPRLENVQEEHNIQTHSGAEC
jgi:hypothetical protein